MDRSRRGEERHTKFIGNSKDNESIRFNCAKYLQKHGNKKPALTQPID